MFFNFITRYYEVSVDELRKKIQEIRDYKYSYEGYRPIIHPKLLEITKLKTSNKK